MGQPESLFWKSPQDRPRHHNLLVRCLIALAVTTPTSKLIDSGSTRKTAATRAER